MQAAGRPEANGGNVLAAIFDEPMTQACMLLQRYGLSKLDVTTALANGVTVKRTEKFGASQRGRGRAARSRRGRGQRGAKSSARILSRPDRTSGRGQARPFNRTRCRADPHAASFVASQQKQPAARRRPRRGQDGDYRRLSAAHGRRRRARGTARAGTCTPSTWAACSPGRATGATSRSA